MSGNRPDRLFPAQLETGMPNQPHRFFDSDFAKVLEGMAYMLELHPEDKALAEELDRFVDLVISAQQPDGYLNTYYTCVDRKTAGKTCSKVTSFTAPVT